MYFILIAQELVSNLDLYYNMKKPDKNEYYKLFSHVIVGYSGTSSILCNNCKTHKQEFSVFLGDDTRMSTLWSYCCEECLKDVVKEANEKGRQNVETFYNRDCKKYYDECVQYVRKTKLDKLGNIIEE